MTSTTRILLRGGHVHGARPSVPATALGIEDGRVVFVGDEDRALAWTGHGEGAPEIVELDGRLVTPAFVDAHVHTVPTGFLHTELDLIGSPSLTDTLDRLHDHVAHGESPEGAVVLGTGWDDTLWAEGLAADVTMLVGNGYVPGHADLALDLLRRHPGVRKLFESRMDGGG